MRKARKGRPKLKGESCKVRTPSFRDNVTGWFGYNCPGGTLLVPSPRCVPPECVGGSRRAPLALGYAGELDAGTGGSFMGARRAAGLTNLTGVEIGKGLAAIDDLRRAGEIDDRTAGYAKAAYRGSPLTYTPLQLGFEGPGAFDKPVAAGAFGKQLRIKPGEPIGPSVQEGCGCKVREPDARDPLSGWFIYYLEGGVLLTPTPKCIAGSSRPFSWWASTWRNVVTLVTGPAAPTGPAPGQTVKPVQPGIVEQPPPGAPPPPPGGYLCLDPRVWPPAFRPQPTPCVPPQIPWPG